MALRDQPYLPLYIQDFLTDEKLIECSAESTGVYIRIMCLMHKSERYGTILLKQKDKQTPKQSIKQKDKQNGSKILSFASKLLRSLPYTLTVIENSLVELVDEGVLSIEGDYLIQYRMAADNSLSIKRSAAGKIGGKKTKLALAKSEANVENANEIKGKTIIVIEKETRVRIAAFIVDVHKVAKDQFPSSMVKEFIQYWSELNKSKRVFRKEAQQYFEIHKRLTTWYNRSDKGTKAPPKDKDSSFN